MSDLFDHAKRMAEADAAKKAAMAQVEANADKDWKALMLELVRLTCLEQPTFTTDATDDRYEAITDPFKPTTHEPRAMGPVMTRAAKLGYCRKTDRVLPSHRQSCHKRPLAVWQSLIFRG